MAVGGPTDNTVGPTIIGAVWIFVKSNGEWIQQGSKLIGTGMVGIGQGFFGSAVALSADGNTVIIGATGDNYWRGSAWVYKRTNGVWTQDGNKITPNDGTARASFGSAVSLSANGLKLFVGAANDATGYGAIWAFTQNSSSNWIQGGPKITFANSTGNSNIGAAMSVSANADRILVGGPLDNGGLGTAWVLRR